MAELRPPWVGRAVAVVALVGAVLLGVFARVRYDRRPRTQDAFLYADSTGIAPEVSGRVIAVHVRENQRVTKGEALVEIDPEPFKLRVDQARAEALALQAQITETSRKVASQRSGAKAAATKIKSAQSQLGLAQNTVARISPLLDKGYTTPQEVDEARSKESVAHTEVAAATKEAQEARESVGDTDSLRAQLTNADAAVRLAERDLHKTVLVAPFDGWVSGFDVPEGTYASVGHPLFTLIKASEWYAVGNFRETQLANIGIGDGATVWLVGSKNQPVHGRVESLGWGVRPLDAGDPGLVNVGRTLEWVIVAQRFPVRVRLDDLPGGVARLGATANILVTHGDHR